MNKQLIIAAAITVSVMACNPNPVKTEAEEDIATTIPQNPVVGAGGRLSAPTNTTAFVGANHGYLDAMGATNSLMNNPKGVDAFFDYGVVFADNANNLVRVLLPATRRAYTVAGLTGGSSNIDGTGWKYNTNGQMLGVGNARISTPTGICAGPSLKVGNTVNFYVLDGQGYIRRISYSGGSSNVNDLKLLNNITFEVTTLLPNTQFKGPADITCDWQNKKLYVVSQGATKSVVQQIALNTTNGTATLNSQSMSPVTGIVLKGLYFDNVQRTGLYVAGVSTNTALQGRIANLWAPGSWNIQAGAPLANVKLYYGDDLISDPYNIDPATKFAGVLTCHSVRISTGQYKYFDPNGGLNGQYNNSYPEDVPQYLTTVPGNYSVVNGVGQHTNFYVFSTVFGTKSTINLNPDLIP